MSTWLQQSLGLRYWPAWLTLALGLTATTALTWGLYRQAVALDAERFKLQTELVAQLLEGTMERYEERLARLADHCAQFDELPDGVWSFRRSEMTDLTYNLPSVMLAVYCLNVAATNFESHAAHGRAVKGSQYAFDPRPHPYRPHALPVWHTWARSGFSQVKPGTDMAEAESWHPSLAGGLARTPAWVSPDPVRVPRKDGKFENGFWFVVPLFKPDQQPMTPWRLSGESDEDRGRRRRAFHATAATGILAAFISTDRMDRAVNRAQVSPQVHVRVYAGTNASPNRLLNPESQPPTNPRHRRLYRQGWYGRPWLLEMASLPRFEANSPRHRAWVVLGGGTGMTLLATALLGVTLRSRDRQALLTEQIRDGRDALASAQKEREKLSHDLHDNTIQALYAIQLDLGHTAQKLANDATGARNELATARAELDAVIAEMRRVITAEAQVENEVDLPSVLRASVERASAGASGAAKVELHCDAGASDRLTGAQAVQLANVAREALSNCLRHAQAQRVEVSLRSEPDAVILEMADNGKGFDADAPTPPGVGLTSMAARAREIGGRLEVLSAPGKGTRVLIRVPVAPLEREAPREDTGHLDDE